MLDPKPARLTIAQQAGTMQHRDAAGVGEEQNDVLRLSPGPRLRGEPDSLSWRLRLIVGAFLSVANGWHEDTRGEQAEKRGRAFFIIRIPVIRACTEGRGDTCDLLRFAHFRIRKSALRIIWWERGPPSRAATS